MAKKFEKISITRLNSELDYKIPEKLLTALDIQKIKVLDDFRKVASQKKIEKLISEENQEHIKRIKAHSRLMDITSDLKEQKRLIDKEFLNPQSIARTPFTLFVNKMQSDIGEIQSIILHRISRAQTNYLQNILTGARADLANFGKLPDWPKNLIKFSGSNNLLEEPCECKDCDAAVSPRAYLADLLDYAIQHIYDKANDTSIDLDYIDSSFYQPIGDLPASCEAINTEVRQVRICIEVLRGYLQDFFKHLTDDEWLIWKNNKFTHFVENQKEYNLNTYSTLLNKIGTSYTEIRQVPSANDKWKASLANRLGLPADILPSLLLNPDSKASRYDALDEVNIERLFGVADTQRNPLSEGAKYNDHRHVGLSDIDLQGVKWNENTDVHGLIYANLIRVSGTQYKVELFSNKEHTVLIGKGSRETAQGEVIINEIDGSGISGKLDLNFNSNNSKLEISMVPELSIGLNGQIKYWNFSNIEWNKNTDQKGNVYVKVELKITRRPGPRTKYYISVYKDQQKTNLVASGYRGTSTGIVILTELNNSGLSGEIELDYIGRNKSILISLIPEFLAGRQKYLRHIWSEQDWPKDLPDNDFPLIDPDLIGPQDFRTPLFEGGPVHPKNAFDLWMRRREWVDQMLLEFATYEVDGIETRTPVFESFLDIMKKDSLYGGNNYNSCWPINFDLKELNTLHKDLKHGKNINEIVATIENTLHLSIDSFNRLIELRNKDHQHRIDPRNEKVTEKELNEIFSILVQARKKSLFSFWKSEEEDLDIPEDFGPKLFWIAGNEPKEGDWPVKLTMPWPAIDPEFITEEELPEAENSNIQKRWWQSRNAQLELIKLRLRQEYQENDFNLMLQSALGDPNEGDPLPVGVRNLGALLSKLDDLDQTVVNNGKQKIISKLFMSVKIFRLMMTIRDKALNSAIGLNEEELEQVCTILTRAEKIKRAYPKWIIQEKIPRIDPDTIKLEEIIETTSGRNSRRFWQSRKAQLENIIEDLKTERESNGFDVMLQKALGNPLPHDVVQLRDDLDSENSKTKHLAIKNVTNELFLTVDQFKRLMIIRTKADLENATNKPTTDEYSEVYGMLQQAQKARLKITEWNQLEISMRLKFWDVYEARLPQWRASYEHRQQWQQALKVRYQPSIIDPDIIGFNDLRDLPTTSLASNILSDRNDELINRLTKLDENKNTHSAAINPLFAIDRLVVESVFDENSQKLVKDYLKNLRIFSNFDMLLWLVFKYIDSKYTTDNIYEDFLKKLSEYILSGDSDKEKEASKNIKQTLFLSVKQFNALILIREKEANGEIITENEWTEVYEILLHSFLVSSVMGLEIEQSLGINIATRLEQFGISNRSFNRLAEIRNLLVLDANVQASEWSDVYSILLQVEKKRNTAAWRNAEKNDEIVLSQDFFKIPEDDLTELLNFKPIAWRSTLRDRRGWTRKLETRIEQEDTLITSMREIISSTEEINLSSLRDSLIKLTIEPAIVSSESEKTFEEQQQWLSDKLIIDTKTGGCQKTTRTSQAITTIQNIIWLIRTGQFKGTMLSTDIELELSSENFDEEWKWMGSYPYWRAAIFVFMYPENILFPALRAEGNQSPIFKKLASSINRNSRFSQDDACKMATEYAYYFHDICHLNMQASCQARVKISDKSCSFNNINEGSFLDLFFMFSVNETSNKIYWSIYDCKESDSQEFNSLSIGQSYWEELNIELEGDIKILGAVPYKITSTERYIYLFLHLQGTKESSLHCRRYDLEKGINPAKGDFNNWEEELLNLTLPDDIKAFDAFVGMQTDEYLAPCLMLQTNAYMSGLSSTVLMNRINNEGTDWKGDWMEWFPHQIVVYGNVRNKDNSGAQNIEVLIFGNDGGRSRFFYTDSNGYYKADYVVKDNIPITIQVRFKKGDDISDPVEITFEHFYGYILDMKFDQNGDLKVDRQSFIGIGNPEFSAGFVIRKLLSFANYSFGGIEKYVVFSWNREYKTFEFLCGTGQVRESNYIRSTFNSIGSGELNDFLGLYPFFLTNSNLRSNISFIWRNQNNSSVSQLFLELSYDSQADIYRCPLSKRHISELSSSFLETRMAHYCSQYQNDSNAENLPHLCSINRRYFDTETGEVSNEIYKFGFALEPQDNPIKISPTSYPTITDNAISLLKRGIEISKSFGRTRQQIFNYTRQAWVTHGRCNKTIRTYLDEAFYFIPIIVAKKLQQTRNYTEALDWLRCIYDFSEQPYFAYYGLYNDQINLNSNEFERLSDWLLDPLNPHAIADTRSGCHVRYVIQAIVRCLLAYADSEYTFDTAESVPRARKLYETANKLLKSHFLVQSIGDCENIIGTIDFNIGNSQQGDASLISLPFANNQQHATIERIKEKLKSVQDKNALLNLTKSIRSDLSGNKNWQEKLTKIEKRIQKVNVPNKKCKIKCSVNGNHTRNLQSQSAISILPQYTNQMNMLSENVTNSTHNSISRHLAINNPGFNSRDYDLRKLEDEWKTQEVSLPVFHTYSSFSYPTPSLLFCIPPNPIINALRLNAELNLFKIHTCRNIAGMERELEPYAAPTDTVSGLPSTGSGGQLILPGTNRIQPTPYRYQYLIERAKQLVQLAAQMETSMLSALEKRDAEYYNRLKAQQDIELAKGQVKLQKIRVKEAEEGVTLSELQRDRSQLQIEAIQEMIDGGLNDYETIMIVSYIISGVAQITRIIAESIFQNSTLAANVAGSGGGFSAPVSAGAAGTAAIPGFAALVTRTVADSIAAAANTTAQVASVYASLERRYQEWEYQQKMASHDLIIGNQGVKIAKTHVKVVEQEQGIAEMQTEHAEEIKDFLGNKFSNADMYDWMSNVLEGVYSYFLQQATSVAKLAYNQIAFERQETPPSFIQADYWIAPSEAGISISNENGTDRKGLTGSARLLQDIYKLDQYAFETDKRKLQLVKTIALSSIAPSEFQQFRQTGKLNFMTSMLLFDQDFPGHYLRLIKKVRTSVIALIPSIEGIKATLSTTGLSRVVVGPDVFQTVNIRRSPQSVALTSPVNATGMFELDTQSEMLCPFEGIGVDTTWEFSMPKAANRFNFNTIADVYLTIEYTALDNYTYRQQVIQELDTTFSAEMPFSIRYNFPDEWYHLHNPENNTDPIVLNFETRSSNFPTNLTDIKIEQLLLAFGSANENIVEIADVELAFSENGNLGSMGGIASTVDGIISTRKGNAGSWIALLGKPPVGNWKLTLPNTPVVRRLIQNNEISDILFVISFDAITPQWPV